MLLQCSATCGTGHQEHVYICEGDGNFHNNNEVAYDCGSRPRELRVCFMPECKNEEPIRNNSICVDESNFCQLPYLSRYCEIPKYNRLCCQSCTKSKYH